MAFSTWFSDRCSSRCNPGPGGSVVDWIAYGHAVQTTEKNKSLGRVRYAA